MPRLDTFELQIRTGEHGLAEPPRYSINGFPLEFDEVEGGTGPGETARVVAAPQSYPHSLLLLGPQEGAWDIAGMTATFYCMGEEPYVLRFSPVTLDDRSDLNIWRERPIRTIEV
jgi:hypothetical protein